MKIKLLSILMTLCLFVNSRADEGMWIPMLIEKYNIKLMQEKGFKLSAEDIYSVNKASMKDAVLIFGGGCTGEIISDEGLVITNHHCGFGMIQEHSTLEHDYITRGFWAMNRQEELPNPGLTVTILKRMEDVTGRVLNGVTDDMTQVQRDRMITENISAIQKEAEKGSAYRVTVRPFYMGNQYFLFVDEVFRDVRLVGAPPSAIGKFGGDTDNWIWPRHTGDFSIFRIYAGKDNKPASYSTDNVPYKPAYHFPISLKGFKEGDFTMVFGYPGTTAEYVPSYHVDMLKNHLYPKLIGIRTEKINIINEMMNADELIRIKYSSKVAGISNAWKKWIGEIQGLNKMNTIVKKQEFESRFMKWVGEDPGRKAKYGSLMSDYEKLYDSLKILNVVNNYTAEVINGADAMALSLSMNSLSVLYDMNSAEENKAAKERLISSAGEIFKDYDMETDKKLFTAVMKLYGENLDEKWLAPEYIKMRNMCKGNFEALAEKIYSESPFTDQERFNRYVRDFNSSSRRKLAKDPLYRVASGAAGFISENVRKDLLRLGIRQQELNRLYMAAQMEFEKERIFYPDANFTLRIAYGKVQGYKSRDAVCFDYFTTLDGIMEKDNPEVYDYDVPDRLKELYYARDYGRYSNQSGQIPVCFIADNHTTGGNSGSPVINAEGHLIGVNFDRAWEGVASDISFNPEQSRNITLDIRYILFIIDKFAGAGYLLDEMTIIE
jgi:hypothetical protein